MTLAFWNNGTPRVVRTNKRVILPGGDIVFNAKPDPEIDLYTYLEMGAGADRFHVISDTAFANDGGSITATHTQALKPLADLQAMRLSDLSAHRYGVENAGMTFGANTIPTYDRAKTLIMGARAMAKDDPTYTKDWKVSEGVYVSLDATTIIAMADALEAHVAAAFANEKTHAEAILALNDSQAVVDYDITTNWPANPEPGQ